MHATAGDLPLSVVCLLSSMRQRGGKIIDLKESGPGFTLPNNIGDLGPDITELSLSNCSLTGAL